jgi:hypothetical protein
MAIMAWTEEMAPVVATAVVMEVEVERLRQLLTESLL